MKIMDTSIPVQQQEKALQFYPDHSDIRNDSAEILSVPAKYVNVK